MGKLNEKYFVTEFKTETNAAPWDPSFTEAEASRTLRLDDDVIKGAFYLSCSWFWPGDWPKDKPWEKMGVRPHKHDYPEVITFFGTNPDDRYDLCGQVELWIDHEKYLIEQSFIAFIPAGITHCPLYIRRVDRPIIHFTSGPGKKYYSK